MNNRRAFIIGLKSTILTKKEFFLLKKYKPWGVILFSRNIKTIKQTKNLTTSIKNLFSPVPEIDIAIINTKNFYIKK
jgi:beta-N-acetylhexosaminidase